MGRGVEWNGKGALTLGLFAFRKNSKVSPAAPWSGKHWTLNARTKEAYFTSSGSSPGSNAGANFITFCQKWKAPLHIFCASIEKWSSGSLSSFIYFKMPCVFLSKKSGMLRERFIEWTVYWVIQFTKLFTFRLENTLNSFLPASQNINDGRIKFSKKPLAFP